MVGKQCLILCEVCNVSRAKHGIYNATEHSGQKEEKYTFSYYFSLDVEY